MALLIIPIILIVAAAVYFSKKENIAPKNNKITSDNTTTEEPVDNTTDTNQDGNNTTSETNASENDSENISEDTSENDVEETPLEEPEEEEIEEIREEREEKESNIEDELIIIDGAKVKFNSHLGEFKVLNDVPTTQDKLTGTVIENKVSNFTFYDSFKLLSLAEWQNFGNTKIQENPVLIKGSTLPGTGKMPGSSSVETGKIEFLDSGQKNIPENIDSEGPIPEETTCFCYNKGDIDTPCDGKGTEIPDDLYESEAERLGIDKAMIMAIAKQESKRDSFWEEGQATILFERHKMWKYLEIDAGKTKEERLELQEEYPNIVNSTAGGYGKYSEQYEKLEIAKEIHYRSAIKSCSWGKFQVMGFNYAVAFSTPEEMEEAVNTCEIQQFVFFIGFLENTSGIIDAMKEKQWEKIATLYNGSNWKNQNPNYANNIKKYYEEFSE